jgi:hypothetical protein
MDAAPWRGRVGPVAAKPDLLGSWARFETPGGRTHEHF